MGSKILSGYQVPSSTKPQSGAHLFSWLQRTGGLEKKAWVCAPDLHFLLLHSGQVASPPSPSVPLPRRG